MHFRCCQSSFHPQSISLLIRVTGWLWRWMSPTQSIHMLLAKEATTSRGWWRRRGVTSISQTLTGTTRQRKATRFELHFSLMSWITALLSAARSVSYHHPWKTDFLRFQVLNGSLIHACSPPIHLLAVTGSRSGQVAESWFTRCFDWLAQRKPACFGWTH